MRERRTRRHGLAAVWAMVAIFALSACTGIPTSSSVVVGPSVDSRIIGGVDFNPPGPIAGASQEQVLRGFIQAFLGPQGDYKVARQFLSSAFASKWDARNGVIVRTGGFSFTQVDATTMVYSTNTQAVVDASGAYTELTTPQPQSLTFKFVQEQGQWRISQAPNGIVLSEGTFRTIFSPQTLYFLDPALKNLVPDLRWFPSGTAATRIVGALLAGPPPWLQGAVTSVFPDGTQLSPPRVVTVESGVAQVDLSSEALAAKGTERQLMQLQLALSLSGVPSIRSVVMTVNGAPYQVDEAAGNLPAVHPQVDARAIVLQHGKFGYYAAGRVTPLDQLSDEVVRLGPRAATVGSDAQLAAVLGAGGVYAVTAGGGPGTLLDQRAGLIAPALDDYGFVWAAQRGSASSIAVYDASGKAYPLAPTLPADAGIVSMAVSRDGARMAVLLDTEAGSRLVVAAILRDASQGFAPTTLGDPILDVVVAGESPVGVDWADELSVATLTSDAESSSVEEYQVGGPRKILGRPGDAIQVVGSNSVESLRVLGADHVVQVQRGGNWSSTQIEVDFIAGQR